MPEFTVSNADLASLKGKVVVITGCASGIGLATVKELLKFEGRIVGGDVSETKPDVDDPNFEYVQVDVTDWKALRSLFTRAISKFGHIDHVFANAGISGRMDLLKDEFDADGELERPDHKTFDINLTAVVDTVRLAIHHIRKNPTGGSVVITASASSYQRFAHYDYTSSKHGVHGLVRGLWSEIGPNTDIPVRINGINPSWTNTGILDAPFFLKAGVFCQDPEIPARSALVLMADGSRHGEMIYTSQGKFFEIESHLLEAAQEIQLSAPSVEPTTRVLAGDWEAIRAAYAQAHQST